MRLREQTCLVPLGHCVSSIFLMMLLFHCSLFFPKWETSYSVLWAIRSVLTHLYTGTVGEHLLVKFVEQGWRSGDCTRLPPTWPGVGATSWLSWLLVLYSVREVFLYSTWEVFFRVFQFSPLLKNQQLIQLVVYYQCCILIGWASTRLYVVAH